MCRDEVAARWMAPVLAFLMLCPVAASASDRGRILPDLGFVPAGIELMIQRLGSSDTIKVQSLVHVDPGWLTTCKWKVTLPESVTPLVGDFTRAGPCSTTAGVFEALVRFDRWGEFEIRGNLFAARDSSNWITDVTREVIRISRDTIDVDRYAHKRYEYVVDGTHYRRGGIPWWTPMDPGEDLAVAPNFLYQNPEHPPTIHAERALRKGLSVNAPTVEVPVLVAVGRNGRVKDALLYGWQRGIPEDAKPAALAAAMKWRSAQVRSLGHSVSALYLIKVPTGSK